MELRVDELAKRLGITPEAISQWDGLRITRKRGRGVSSTVDPLDLAEYLYKKRTENDDEDPLKFQRIRLTRADADKRELEVSIMRGEYIQADEVKTRLGFIFTEFRTKILGLKPLIKVLLPDLPDKDLDALEKLHKDALRALDADVLPAAIKASRDKVK